MALTQTHLDLRASLSDKLVALKTEAANLATSVARHTAIGTLSTADGGAASTGEIAVAVAALTELLDPATGNPDFSGVSPSFATPATIVGGNVGTDTISVATVADVLASPLVKLRPVSGPDLDVSAWVTLSTGATRIIGGLAHPQVRIKLGPIPGGARAAFNASYKLVVQNPLDAASVEVVSVGSATFVYAG